MGARFDRRFSRPRSAAIAACVLASCLASCLAPRPSMPGGPDAAPDMKRGAGLDAGLDAGLSAALARAGVDSLRPGFGACVFDSKGVLWSRFGGYSNEAADIRFSADTVFRVGEVSEIATAMTALRLAERGMLDLEIPISARLPEIFEGASPGSALAEIGGLRLSTILGHLGGTSATFFLGYQDYDPFSNPRRFLEGAHLKYRPGTKYLRSGGLFDLLGPAIERASGMGFEAAVEAELFDPLGMAASSFAFADSPRYATLKYKSGVQDGYVLKLPAFREVVAPSGSMQSTMADLVRLYSSLLAPGGGGGRLSPASVQAMFERKSEIVARRQGLEVGYVWRLSLPELGHLGRVAWQVGKYFSHRNAVVLARDPGVGAAVATNSWSIFDRETVLPGAIELLRAYCALELGRPAPVERRPSPVPLPADLRDRITATYASDFGLVSVRVKGERISLESNGSCEALYHGGGGEFYPEGGSELSRLSFLTPRSLELVMRSGIRIEAARVEPDAGSGPWLRIPGIYRLEDGSAAARGVPYAFELGSIGGSPTLTDEEARSYLLASAADGSASVLCGEDCRFFGRALRIRAVGGIAVDGNGYELAARGAPAAGPIP